MFEIPGDILRYAEIERLRDQLRRGNTPSRDQVTRFAGSVVSLEDVDLLKSLMKVGASSDLAGDTAFALFTRGGIGNLNTAIREWFEAGDVDSGMTESAPLVLAGCVRQLDDGTALRLLFEFADIPDVNVVLKQLLSDCDQVAFERIFRQSTSEQVDRLILERGQAPSNRFLWVLRTYGRNTRVSEFLLSWSLAGFVAALASFSLSSDVLDWGLLAVANPQSDFEMRLVVNIALENIRRGAKWGDAESRAFMVRLSPGAAAEFLNGLPNDRSR